jgi:copper chaperone CopZ
MGTVMPPVVEHSFRVKGKDGASWAGKVEAVVRKLAGTSDVNVDVQSEAMTVLLDPAVASPDAVARAVESIGYAVEQG